MALNPAVLPSAICNYQQLRGASAGTSARGGINPSSVGYGAQLSSIDLLMGQSAMSSTGNPLDVAITGEGFLQVQDADGNVFYTKAGMLDIDPQGRLVDSNGNLVLGTSAAGGKLNSSEPGRSIIQLPSIGGTYSGLDKNRVLGRSLRSSVCRKKTSNVSFTFSSSRRKKRRQQFATSSVEVSWKTAVTNIAVRMNANYRFTLMAALRARSTRHHPERTAVPMRGAVTFELSNFLRTGFRRGIDLHKVNSTPACLIPTFQTHRHKTPCGPRFHHSMSKAY
jgi:flagellar hook-basal body protein